MSPYVTGNSNLSLTAFHVVTKKHQNAELMAVLHKFLPSREHITDDLTEILTLLS